MDQEFDISWALAEPIEVTQIDDHNYRINGTGGRDAEIRIQITEGRAGQTLMFLDGEYHDLGDDFIRYLSIIDEYHEHGGDIGTTIRQVPFRDEF